MGNEEVRITLFSLTLQRTHPACFCLFHFQFSGKYEVWILWFPSQRRGDHMVGQRGLGTSQQVAVRLAPTSSSTFDLMAHLSG